MPQEGLQVRVAVGACLRLLPNLQYVEEYEEVEDPDDPEKGARNAKAMTTARMRTIVECPSEKKNPTPKGRSPFCSM